MLREKMTNALGGIGSSINSVADRLGSMGTQRRNLVGGEGNLPTLLRGASAALTGQVPQFRQQLMQEQQFQTAQGLQNLDIKNALATSAAQDSLQIRNMLLMNNDAGAMEILQDRMSLESDLGASSEATQQLMNLIQTDPMQAFMNVDAAVRSAYQLGLIKVPELTPAQKYDLERDKADWNSARDSIRDTMEENNRLAADAVTGFNKLGSLANFIKIAQQDNATDMQKRAGRQAAATILTIMARMASPGVVTDRDFANQAGGQSLQAGVITYIRNLGQTNPEVASLLANYDPTNPELIDVDSLVNQAKGLIVGQAPSILSTYASQRERATAYNPTRRFMNAEFGSTSARNITDLVKVSYGDEFDTNEFFANPSSYLQQQNLQAQQSQPESQLSYKFNSLADAQAAFEAGVPVELIIVDENNSGIYKPVKFE